MIKLFNKDCLSAMIQMPDNFFDLAIVDPPYGIGNWVQTTGNVRGKAIKWNNNIPPKKYFIELQRVSKHRIIWGANYFNCFEKDHGAVIWNKRVPEKSNFSQCEIASTTLHKRVVCIDLIWQNINRTEHTIHPCQKPIALYNWLLNKYAKKNYRILDTHLGSGSSAIASYDYGCEFYGYEIDKNYFSLAKKRLNNHKKQIKIF